MFCSFCACSVPKKITACSNCGAVRKRSTKALIFTAIFILPLPVLILRVFMQGYSSGNLHWVDYVVFLIAILFAATLAFSFIRYGLTKRWVRQSEKPYPGPISLMICMNLRGPLAGKRLLEINFRSALIVICLCLHSCAR